MLPLKINIDWLGLLLRWPFSKPAVQGLTTKFKKYLDIMIVGQLRQTQEVFHLIYNCIIWLGSMYPK